MSISDDALLNLNGIMNGLDQWDPDLVNIPQVRKNIESDLKILQETSDYGKTTFYLPAILKKLEDIAKLRHDLETAVDLKRDKIIYGEKLLATTYSDKHSARISHDIGQDCSNLANYLFKSKKKDKTAFLYSFVASNDAYNFMHQTNVDASLRRSIIKSFEFVAYHLTRNDIKGFDEADLEFIVKGNSEILSKRTEQIKKIDYKEVHDMWKTLKTIRDKNYGRH